MTDELINLIHREIARYMALRQTSRVGLVSAYDPERHAVKMRLMPEDVETAWIPLTSQHIGNGFGVAFGPEIGDQLEVTFQEGDIETGRITGRLFSDEDKPPKVEAGEIIIKRKDGSMLGMDKNGNVTIASKGLVKINC